MSERTFVFIRGVDTPYKRSIVRAVMDGLNPSPNDVKAIRLAMSDYVKDMATAEKGDLRAADRTVKNHVKKVFQHHTEEYLVIDNESLQPQNWTSFLALARSLGVEPAAICIEVVPDPKNLTDAEKRRSNLQDRKRDMFISISPKYFECRDDDPKSFVKALLAELGESKNAHQGTSGD